MDKKRFTPIWDSQGYKTRFDELVKYETTIRRGKLVLADDSCREVKPCEEEAIVQSCNEGLSSGSMPAYASMAVGQQFSRFDSETLVISGRADEIIDLLDFCRLLKNLDGYNVSNLMMYKYYKIENLSYVLRNGMIFMEKVNSWSDASENIFLKEGLVDTLEGERLNTDDMSDAVFGQSWTYASENDKMWRKFSPDPDKSGVRIRASFLKLMAAVFIDASCMADTLMGKVEYKTLKEFEDYYNKKSKSDAYIFLRNELPDSLFVKKDEFSYEEELRVVKMLDTVEYKKYKGCKRIAFKVDIDDFIDEFVLDPRLNDAEYESRKRKLIEIGADGSKIFRSSLSI